MDEATSKLLAGIPLSITGAEAVAWHLEQGQDNGGISREGLAVALRNYAVELKVLLSALDASQQIVTQLLETGGRQTLQEANRLVNLQAEVDSLRAQLDASQKELLAVRQILAEYPHDEALQIQARTIDKFFGESAKAGKQNQ